MDEGGGDTRARPKLMLATDVAAFAYFPLNTVGAERDGNCSEISHTSRTGRSVTSSCCEILSTLAGSQALASGFAWTDARDPAPPCCCLPNECVGTQSHALGDAHHFNLLQVCDRAWPHEWCSLTTLGSTAYLTEYDLTDFVRLSGVSAFRLWRLMQAVPLVQLRPTFWDILERAGLVVPALLPHTLLVCTPSNSTSPWLQVGSAGEITGPVAKTAKMARMARMV